MCKSWVHRIIFYEVIKGGVEGASSLKAVDVRELFYKAIQEKLYRKYI